MSNAAKTVAQMVMIVGLGYLAQSCTTRKQIVPQPGLQPQPAGQNKPGSNGNGGSVTLPTTTEGSSSSIPLDEAALKTAYGLDTSKLTYHFHYLDMDKADAITFTGGKAVLEFHGLTQGKQGDMTLDLLQDGVVKVHGQVSALTLNAGKNSVNLVLSAVGPSTGATGDLSIDVKIDGGGNGSGNNGSGTQPTLPQGNQSQQPQQPANPSGYFATTVKPVLDQYCSECHHAGKTLDLSSPTSTAAMIDKVIASTGDNTMPPAPRDRMPADAVEKLKTWKAQGLKP